MYITYTDDDRIVVSSKRLTKTDIATLEKQGVEFLGYEDIEYEKHGDTLIVEVSSHLSVDDL